MIKPDQLEMRSNGQPIQIDTDWPDRCLSCHEKTLCVEISADDPFQAAYLCLPCTEKLARLFREYVDGRSQA